MGQDNSLKRFNQGESSHHPGHDSARNKHHCRAILEYFRQLPVGLQDRQCPSTAELTQDGRFGLRPPNRINDLVHGKFDGHHYDFERIAGERRGEFRWRLHEPNRFGYPRHERQGVLPLAPQDSQPSYHRNMSKARRAPHAWKSQSIVPARTWADVVREREEKLASEPEWSLTP